MGIPKNKIELEVYQKLYSLSDEQIQDGIKHGHIKLSRSREGKYYVIKTARSVEYGAGNLATLKRTYNNYGVVVRTINHIVIYKKVSSYHTKYVLSYPNGEVREAAALETAINIAQNDTRFLSQSKSLDVLATFSMEELKRLLELVSPHKGDFRLLNKITKLYKRAVKVREEKKNKNSGDTND